MTPFIEEVAAECAALLNEDDSLSEDQKNELFAAYCEIFLGIPYEPGDNDFTPLP